MNFSTYRRYAFTGGKRITPSRWIWCLSRDSIFAQNQDGTVSQIIGTFLDITERKQAEENLKKSERRYRNLFQNHHAAMLLIDPLTGDIINANPAACDYYGYTLDEITGLKISDINILTPEQVRSEMKLAKSKQSRQFFFKHLLADGRIRDVEVFSGPVFIKDRELLYSIVHDITARKQAEEDLRTLSRFNWSSCHAGKMCDETKYHRIDCRGQLR